MTQLGQWPAGANDTKRMSHRCPGCGAVSSTPLNHDHSKKSTPKKK
ncbi:hypothetical protein ACFV0L_43615 [Streptosporangium canum]